MSLLGVVYSFQIDYCSSFACNCDFCSVSYYDGSHQDKMNSVYHKQCEYRQQEINKVWLNYSSSQFIENFILKLGPVNLNFMHSLDSNPISSRTKSLIVTIGSLGQLISISLGLSVPPSKSFQTQSIRDDRKILITIQSVKYKSKR